MRLDLYLNTKFNTGRERAKELIKNDKVEVDNKIVSKPSFEVTDDMNVIILDDEFNKYVSRGAYKLLQAIEECALNVEGLRCIDIGASTGGFTDVLVQNGAREVFSIDTGTLQLHEKLRGNDRIISMENTNILDVNSEKFGKFDFACCDVSFVSITKIIPHIYTLINEKANCVFLVKPQFEVGKNKLNKKGVVTDKRDRENVLNIVIELCNALGFKNIRTMESKTKGHSGNTEYLLICTKGEL